MRANEENELSGRPFRGFMLDSARCLENRAHYRAFIDFAAQRGSTMLLWHFTDDQGCSLKFDSIPGLASPNAYSKTELRELVAYAAERGVEIVPELASLGHTRYVTRLPEFHHLAEAADGAHFSGMCPLSDQTRELFRQLIGEVCEVFDSRNFHVGFDEVNIGGHPLTQAALKTRTKGDLLADYAIFLNDVVRNNGRRMWMWADCTLKHREMLARIPKDVVMCDWQYLPNASPTTSQMLLDNGFDVLLCSALISHDQTLFPGQQFSLPNVRAMQQHESLVSRGKILGHITTVWTPVRYIADAMWLGIDLAAAIQRDGPKVAGFGALQRFGREFYGFGNTAALRFAEAATLLTTRSPRREEWVAIAKLRLPSGRSVADVRSAADEWAEAAEMLGNLAIFAKSHSTELAAFRLMFDLLAYAYSACAVACDPASSSASLRRTVAAGHQIVRRLSEQWDAERFANDARKWMAPIASFQDDHLIPLIEGSVTTLEATLPALAIEEIRRSSLEPQNDSNTLPVSA